MTGPVRQPGEPVTAIEFTPRTLNQLFGRIAANVRTDLKEGRGLVAVRGVLETLPDKERWTTHYGSQLTGGGEAVFLDIPKDLAQDLGVEPGDYVKATGILDSYANTWDRGKLEFRLRVVALEASEPTDELQQRRRERDVLTILRQRTRCAFPTTDEIAVTVVHPASDQVSADFMGQLGAMEGVHVEKAAVRITDPTDVARGIEQAGGDVLVLLRGGGSADQFKVFEDPLVLGALSKKRAYRVLGVGHSVHLTVADLLCDQVVDTPTAAGSHIRERIQESREQRRFTAAHDQLQRSNELIRAKLAEADARLEIEQAANAVPFVKPQMDLLVTDADRAYYEKRIRSLERASSRAVRRAIAMAVIVALLAALLGLAAGVRITWGFLRTGTMGIGVPADPARAPAAAPSAAPKGQRKRRSQPAVSESVSLSRLQRNVIDAEYRSATEA